MSAHYSKFGLNTCCQTPYFRAHLPEDYPIDLVLQKTRTYRHLPPNLKELSEKSREWLFRVNPTSVKESGINRWYDADGYELNPATGARLTDTEIAADWTQSPPDIEVKDIPIPSGGFPDPQTWEPEQGEEVEEEREDQFTEEQLLSWIKSHGRERVIKDFGPRDYKPGEDVSDEEVARAVAEYRANPSAPASS